MYSFVLIIHVLVCLSIIALVLLQQGKGATMGAGMGGGASQTLFGSQGPASFLFKLTGGLALVFFVTSIGLTRLNSQARHANQHWQMPILQDQSQSSAPPLPAPARSELPHPAA